MVRIHLAYQNLDVLNRYSDPDDIHHVVHVMKYIFPRQFRLHNVFTSSVDLRETVQPFKDYTLRESEIAALEASIASRRLSQGTEHHPRVPKRLRGRPMEIISELQRRHNRCSYVEIFRHYCPVEVFEFYTSSSNQY